MKEKLLDDLMLASGAAEDARKLAEDNGMMEVVTPVSCALGLLRYAHRKAQEREREPQYHDQGNATNHLLGGCSECRVTPVAVELPFVGPIPVCSSTIGSTTSIGSDVSLDFLREKLSHPYDPPSIPAAPEHGDVIAQAVASDDIPF